MDLGDEDLTARLSAQWGTLRGSGKERDAERERYRTLLRSGAPVDRSRGRTLFEQRCSACHVLWGEGGRAGPDLTGSDRRNLDYLLENILDPNAAVPEDYRLTTVVLKDGQVLGGFVEEELAGAIRLRSQVQQHTISRDRIERTEVSEVSLMPAGLLKGLSDDEVRDLFAYLRGEEQAPFPEEE